MRHSCWGFIESACMKTSLPDAGNTLYTVRGTAGVGRPRAAREPGPASRPPRSGPPPIRRTSGESFMFYVKYRNGRLTYARLKTRYSTLLGHVRVLDVTFGGTLHVSRRNAVRSQLLAYAALTHLSALLVPLLLAPPLPCVHASRLVCMQLDLCACNSTCESSLDHVGRPSDLASISTPPAAAAQNAPPALAQPQGPAAQNGASQASLPERRAGFAHAARTSPKLPPRPPNPQAALLTPKPLPVPLMGGTSIATSPSASSSRSPSSSSS